MRVLPLPALLLLACASGVSVPDGPGHDGVDASVAFPEPDLLLEPDLS